MQFIGEKQLQGVGIFLHFHATVIIVHLCGDSFENRSTIEQNSRQIWDITIPMSCIN